MITDTLIVLAAIVVIAVIWAAAAWFIQREPAGHGQHGMRRSLDLDWDKDLPCFQPDPRFALELHHEPHRDVVAATLHNPGLLDDIRTERTRNLPGPDTGSVAAGEQHDSRRTGEQLTSPGNLAQVRAGEPVHRDWTQRPLSVVRDGLAPYVAAALAGAKVGDTAYGPIHDNTPFGQWLEQVTGGDAFDGKGSSDAYVDWLFAGMAGAR